MKSSLIFALLLTGVASAAPVLKPGDVLQTVKFPLSAGKSPDKLQLVVYKTEKSDMGVTAWAQLKVYRADGKLAWASPQTTDESSKFAFGAWPIGEAKIDWVGYLDPSHKQVGILSAKPQVDVQPTKFNRLAWDKGNFKPLPEAALIGRGAPPTGGIFTWEHLKEWNGQDPISWIKSIQGTGEKPVAEIITFAKGQASSGKAILDFEKNGYTIKKWVVPLGPTK